MLQIVSGCTNIQNLLPNLLTTETKLDRAVKMRLITITHGCNVWLSSYFWAWTEKLHHIHRYYMFQLK